ncbi:hypothetical protein [Burkholderia ubonensis]|uniref:hypothetical protein n=1 Tax=Burkholderia ubonensis TaxID=101571 RepID=UPI0018DEF2A4|nr:hypothetical protein [Burkholderia ubonensis]
MNRFHPPVPRARYFSRVPTQLPNTCRPHMLRAIRKNALHQKLHPSIFGAFRRPGPKKNTIAAHFGLTFLQCRIPRAHAKSNTLIINEISIRPASRDQEKAGASRTEHWRTGRFFDTRDADFMQPAPFLRLTNIAEVMNNRWRNRKPFFST